MASSGVPHNPTLAEPQLKYEPLQGDVPSVLSSEPLTCLCLSDKILAIGTEAGTVHVLDYSGNQVRALQHHKQPVCDLSVDGAGEHVASCSRDKAVVISSLYADTVVRHEYQQPVQSLALDPRYASRKTREVAVVLGDTGAVHLSAQGWLGRGDTALSKGPGTQLVRWWGQLIAWITGSSLMVYSTVQHLLVRKLPRPSKGAAAAYRHASLLWGQNGYLYASWPDCILVLRTYTVESSVGVATQQVEVMAQWHPQQLVLGVSPFGHDLAVLTFQSGWAPSLLATLPSAAGQASSKPVPEAASGEAGRPDAPDAAPGAIASAVADTSGVGAVGASAGGAQAGAATAQAQATADSSTPAAAGQDTEQTGDEGKSQEASLEQQAGPSASVQDALQWGTTPEAESAQLQLRIMGLHGTELACDTLQVPSLLSLLPGGRSPYMLVPSLPATTTAATDKKRLRKHGATARPPPAPSPTPGLQATPPRTPKQGSAAPVSQHGDKRGESNLTGTPRALSRASSGQLSGSARASEHGSSPRSSQAGAAQAAVKAGTRAAGHEPVYEDDAEFMYFVTTPQAVLVGRMRDLSDHVEWLCSQGQWEQALLSVEERPRQLRPDVQDKVVQGYIGALLARGAWEEAAVLSPRLMRGNATLWERWAYMFAQARQLPLLARVLPTDQPRLSQAVYDMVLTSLLAHPQDHHLALQLVKAWPVGCFNAPALVQAVVSRVNRTGQGGADMAANEPLWRLLAHLYEHQGRPDLALSILLELRDTAAFAFIAGRHEGLLAGLSPKRVAALVSLEPPRAIRLLVRHADVVPPTRVVPALQEAMSVADEEGDAAARERWRHALWSYLAALHDADPAAAAPYSELQVSLTADYAPSKLLELLGSSSSRVPLEAALAICEEKGLVAEQVFILGRMGNALRALHLIIDQLADIPQAIAFVEGQGDEELWEQLINWALSSPDTTGSLLDHIGGHLNPLALIRRIPRGLTIPRLRDRIRSIIADFRTQTSLREGCNVILRADCARLATRLHRLAAAAVGTVYVAPAGRPAVSTSTTNATGAGWARYELREGCLQPLTDLKELPPTVAMAAAALAELQEVPHKQQQEHQQQQGSGKTAAAAASALPGSQASAGGPGGVTGGQQGKRGGQQGGPVGLAWVGCLPTQSSEDAVSGLPVAMSASELGTPAGRPHKPSSHPYAVRKRLQASAAESRRLAGEEGAHLHRDTLTSLIY